MNFSKVIFVFGLWLMIGVSAHAQDQAIDPFERLFFIRAIMPQEQFARRQTDIYSWSPGEATPHQETSSSWANAPVVSPDGTKVVYTMVSQSIIDLLERGEDYPYGAAPYPTDIWLIDTAKPLDDPSRHAQIADQITGLPDAETPFQIRSTPVWSPDSTRIAWIELHDFSAMFAGRIMVYDTRTDVTTLIAAPVTLGYADAGEWGVPRLKGWGAGVAYVTANAGVHPEDPNGGFGAMLGIYDEAGTVDRKAVTYWLHSEDWLVWDQWDWVRRGDDWLVNLVYLRFGSVLFNPRTKTYELPSTPPTFGSLLGDGRTMAVVTDPNAGESEWPVEVWTLEQPDVESQPPDNLTFITFAPLGEPLFFDHQTGQLVYWNWANGETIPVLPGAHDELWRDFDASWIPGVWTVSGDTTPVEPP